MGIPKWLAITAVSVITITVLAVGVTFIVSQVNQSNSNSSVTKDSPTETPAPVNTAPAVQVKQDDSAAQNALLMVSGALNQVDVSGTSSDCDYLGLVIGMMSTATPLDSYRGTYEQIQTNAQTVYMLCGVDPSSEDAKSLARSTRSMIP